ncbi:MAG: hypothetical protein NXH75_02240 [Halobacteriovoraceae bacterium]|nr:hypothetical protein [Halobacteriovoraceae bacterium]
MSENKQSLWEKFRAGLFTNAQIFTGVTLSLLFTSGLVYAFTIANLNVFTPGTPISASQMNDNFTYVNERLAALGGGKFEVSNSATFAFGSWPCCASSTQRVMFDTVDEDLSGASSLASAYVATGTFTAAESRFYEVSLIGKLTAGSLNGGQLSIQKTSGGSTSTPVTLWVYTTDTTLNGQKSDMYLNAGDKIEVVGSAQCCSGNNANFDAGIKFSIRKL